MAEWHVSFEGILALHQSGFVAASLKSCRDILRTVRDNIIAQNNSKDEPLELPKALKKAIRRYYRQFLTDEDDILAEEELLGDEPDNEKFGLSPEEREAAAHPKDAGFYKKEVSDWDVAQKLFKQEIDQYDKEEQVKLGAKNEIKYRTGHAREWFRNMTPAQRKEVEDAREKWNREGAPPESQAMYRKRHLKKYLDDFTEQMCRTMGCRVVILASHKKPADQTLNVIVNESKPVNSKKHFTQSSRGNKQWTSEGFEKYAEWSKLEFYPEENDDNSDEEDKDKDSGLPDLILDNNGYAKLPSQAGVPTRGQQELVRQIFRASYKVLTDTSKPVPWRDVVGNPTLYLDPDSLPKGFILRDPSHMRAENVNQLWTHWEGRKAAKKPLVIFMAAKIGDMSKKRLENAVPYQEKTKKKYVEIEPAKTSSTTGGASARPTSRRMRPAGSDPSEDESAGAAPTSRRKTSAEPHSSEDEPAGAASTGRAPRPATRQLGAPAAVPIKDHIQFLKSLSNNNEYLLLVEGIRDFGKEPSLKEQKEWPAWATWSWEGSYLPSGVHSVDRDVHKFLQIAESVKISGFSSAMRVTLGLGLLLRECKRAIEYEEDEVAFETPAYISSSFLDIKILDLVVEAVKKVRGGAMRLLKAKLVQQESAIVDKAVVGEGSGADDGMDTTADGEQGVTEEKLADELKKLEEENCRSQELKQELEAKRLQLKEVQEVNSRLAKEMEENEKRVEVEEKEKDDNEEEEEEEEEEEMKGKKRTKFGRSQKPSKKVSGDVRRSSRSRQPTKKAMKH
ncbi:uncharacterized protein EDB93DRAFT_1245954 [Suillus bovinus]|uniref:uncharacterized protein n=1 Tax=Suillus bovinus TaxID=48563 RepID=UPI001B87B941|nr:uncharacterized protein EDB93DRAFT_1245954 [Suillus bovinus]KAG2158722.1 hypothetical protein EDB93DRAFT_1245954 [Suillus bovinus]